MKTSQKQISLFTEDPLTSLLVDFPANHIQMQERDLGKMTSDTYGRICSEQFKRLSQPTLWAKTFVELLIGTGEWYSKKCALTWKLVGTKYNRYYCQLVPSVRHTEEIEFGLLLKTPCAADAHTENLNKKEQDWGNSGTLAQEVMTGFVYKRGMIPTPTAMDSTDATNKMKSSQVKDGSMHSVTLNRWIGMLPTPQASDIEGGTTNPEQISQKDGGRWVVTRKSTGTEFGAKLRDVAGLLPTPRANDVNGSSLENNEKLATRNKSNLEEVITKALLPTPTALEGEKYSKTYNPKSQMGSGLSAMAGSGLLPTPTASDKNQGSATPSENFPRHTALNHLTAQTTGRNSQLNPLFVEEMMGFPTNWIILPYLTELENPENLSPFQNGDKRPSKPTETP